MASAPIPVLISEEATRLPFVQAMVDFASRLASDRSAQVAAKRRLKPDHATPLHLLHPRRCRQWRRVTLLQCRFTASPCYSTKSPAGRR